MFEIRITDSGEVIMTGRLDASQTDKAKAILDTITKSAVVNFKDLDYISSAGLGILIATQRRLREQGQGLKLTKMNKHIRDVFRYARFDMVFEIE